MSSASVSALSARLFGADTNENVRVLERYLADNKMSPVRSVVLHNNGKKFVLERERGFTTALALFTAFLHGTPSVPFDDTELSILDAFYGSKVNLPETSELQDPDHRVIKFMREPQNASIIVPRK